VPPSAAVAIAWWAIDLLIWSVLAQTKQSAMREAHVGARPAQPLARAPPYVPEQLEHKSGALTPLLQQFQQPENWEGLRASPASDVGGPGRVLAPDRGRRQLDQAKETAVLYVIVPLALAVLGLSAVLSWWLIHKQPRPRELRHQPRRDPYSPVKREHEEPRNRWQFPDE
jgi:hypothetical protein